MKAVITVVGKDTVGILAKVSGECAKYNVNILEVSQTILQDMFCMIMIGDIDRLSVPFGEWSDALAKLGSEHGSPRYARGYIQFNASYMKGAAQC